MAMSRGFFSGLARDTIFRNDDDELVPSSVLPKTAEGARARRAKIEGAGGGWLALGSSSFESVFCEDDELDDEFHLHEAIRRPMMDALGCMLLAAGHAGRTDSWRWQDECMLRVASVSRVVDGAVHALSIVAEQARPSLRMMSPKRHSAGPLRRMIGSHALLISKH